MASLPVAHSVDEETATDDTADPSKTAVLFGGLVGGFIILFVGLWVWSAVADSGESIEEDFAQISEDGDGSEGASAGDGVSPNYHARVADNGARMRETTHIAGDTLDLFAAQEMTRAETADSFDMAADVSEALHAELVALTPPDDYQTIHDQTLILYSYYRDAWRSTAACLRSANPEACVDDVSRQIAEAGDRADHVAGLVAAYEAGR